MARKKSNLTEFSFNWEHFWRAECFQGSPYASQETLDSWELKGHSMSHAFEEERQAH